MPRIAKVVAGVALDREFDYLIPETVDGNVTLGSRVLVPFGRTRTKGYVVGLASESEHQNLKSILSVDAPEPFLNEHVLCLVRWMSEYYCAPIEHVLKSVLPSPVRRSGMQHKQRLLVSVCQASASAEGASLDLSSLSPKQSAAWLMLSGQGDMFLHELTRALGITAAPVRALEKKGLVNIGDAPQMRSPLGNRNILPTQALKLSNEQEESLQSLVAMCDAAQTCNENDNSRVMLLHGVTGSGKTEIYLQAISHVLASGRNAIVLVPEISLTPQTIERFVSRFGDGVAILHSKLSDGERYDEWHRIRQGRARIVVGARSAVFAPMPNLGLIVVDEEHEPSYKQEETPRYNARDVAIMRSRFDGCAVVLGSATPSLESWMNTVRGKYVLSTLSRRVDNRRLPAIRVVDMRAEAQQSGRIGVLSKELMSAIQERLGGAEQTILFLNRRGFSSSLLCVKCGHRSDCDFCSVACTYHRQDDSLRCHICGRVNPVPRRCPACGDPQFKFAGIGTQRVERIVQKCFPHARVQRLDSDVTGRKDAYERILGDFRAGRTDILIGTQMIAKGLHFPNVTLVGVICADLSLHVPDFRAGERTFQLLTQVAGRAGRGEMPGEVIIQTFTPHHPAVQAARRTDYLGFSDQELEFRRELKYPPFSHMICITLAGVAEEKVAFAAKVFSKELAKQMDKGVLISPPTPAPIARAKGRYRYQIFLRAGSTLKMTRPLKTMVQKLKLPPGVKCSVDVDALSML